MEKKAHCKYGYTILMLVSFAMTAEVAVGQLPAVDALKSFLAAPPPLDNVVFKRRFVYQPYFPGVPTVDTNASQIFWARWQDGDFVPREVRALEEIEDPKTITNSLFVAHGKSGNMFWRLLGDNYMYYEDRSLKYSKDYLSQERFPWNKRVLSAVLVARGILLDVVNMGIAGLEPHTLRWTGNLFAARDLSNNRITGELIVVENVPKEVRYCVNGGPSSVIIQYEYHPNAKLPSRISSLFQTAPEVRTPLMEWMLFSIHVVPSRLPSEAFSGHQFHVNGFTKSIAEENDSLFLVNHNGNRTALHATTTPPLRKRLLLMAIFGITAVLFISAISLRMRKKQHSDTE